jgi:hypothetical protein
MNKTIYSWCGDYFCSDCIVFALLEQEPWNQWSDNEENDPSEYNTAATLNLIAHEFHIPANRQQQEAANFPVRLRKKDKPEGTHFCRACLTLLTMESDHAT